MPKNQPMLAAGKTYIPSLENFLLKSEQSPNENLVIWHNTSCAVGSFCCLHDNFEHDPWSEKTNQQGKILVIFPFPIILGLL